MKEIQLSKGEMAIIDDEDYNRVAGFKWHVYADGYVRSRAKDGKTILLHREIMNNPIGFDVDHINNEKLDNRKSNLRSCNRSQNMANSRDDGYKGVRPSLNKWVAWIGYNYKRYYLGTFDSPIEAKAAYDKKARELFGEFAK